MSVEQQVTELLSGVDNSSAEKAKTNLELARQEVEKLLRATNSSVYDLCMYIERAKNRLEVKAAFKKFNVIIRMFREAAPGAEHDSLVRKAICSVRLSVRLKALMETAGSVPLALAQYKEGVVTDLAKAIQPELAG